MSNIRPLILLLLFLSVTACDDESEQFSGVSGHAFTVGSQFVMLDSGYQFGDVTWVVVRDWPIASSPEQRLADKRLVLGADGEYRVRQASGELTAPTAGVAFFFHGDNLTTFSIRMREDDFIGFRVETLNAYSDVESFLRRFEQEDIP